MKTHEESELRNTFPGLMRQACAGKAAMPSGRHVSPLPRILCAILTAVAALVFAMAGVVGEGTRALAQAPDGTPTATPTAIPTASGTRVASTGTMDIEVVTKNLVSRNGATVTVSTSLAAGGTLIAEVHEPTAGTLAAGAPLEKAHPYAHIQAAGRYTITQQVVARSGNAESRLDQEVILSFNDAGLPEARILRINAVPEPGNPVLDIADDKASPLLISIKIGRVQLLGRLVSRDASAIKGEPLAEFSATPQGDAGPEVKSQVPVTIQANDLLAQSPVFVSSQERLPFRVRYLGADGTTLADVPSEYNFKTGAVTINAQSAPIDKAQFKAIKWTVLNSAQSYDVTLPPVRVIGSTDAGPNQGGGGVSFEFSWEDDAAGTPTPLPSKPGSPVSAATPTPVVSQSVADLNVQVVRRDTGDVVSKARVTALLGNSRFFGVANPQGAVPFQKVPAGEYTLRAEAEGFKAASSQAKVDAGVPTNQVMVLDPIPAPPPPPQKAVPYAKVAVLALIVVAILAVGWFGLKRALDR